ncbi:two-component system response regulator RppA [Chamaesiphon minutus]|uniref:Response regulator with CheY-like receiver domain and winged-helix DNA-binding domain n=1 Tax=Chamaesiphon minutus (strain ATCC 27169 / PCC 6605) TaxID=1173020 RepID=K9UCX8_CHAP6|nr:two-component system response regulator RppA [Chamaesiphon minutus]AFY92962.1 response regulator with CheY-like receiver domain and winged-helix DNA-binding domain [Chamaesiphon minutus PCC 6605]
MKILLIEDEPDLGAIIQKILSRHQYVVDWAEDGKTGWEYLTNDRLCSISAGETTYALAIIDWMLPKMSGIEICQRLRAEKYTLPILMLTAKDRMENKIAGLDAGADDYLVKPFGMEELLARLRALQRRTQVFQAERLQLGNLRLDYGNNAIVTIDLQGREQSGNLTAKEFQLLEYLMQHPDRTLTHDQIRNRIWPLDSESASNVVAAQIRLLRKKLAEFGCDSSIETMRGFGYRLNSIHK